MQIVGKLLNIDKAIENGGIYVAVVQPLETIV